MLGISDLEGKVRVNDQHFCRTQLVCLENTTNLGGGRVYPLAQLQQVSAWAQAAGLKRHLDGARLFNALVAGQYTAADVARCFDTISICFSKGLGCPVGSMLLGSAADMAKARRIRKLFGGGLRQSGMLAAAAIHALEHHVDRLADDHLHARQLAAGFQRLNGVTGIASSIETNLVFFELAPEIGTAVQFAGAMRDRGVLIGPMGGQRVRVVTHIDVSADDVQTALTAAADAFQQGFRDRPIQGKGPFSR
jgi:threonine aldolase